MINLFIGILLGVVLWQIVCLITLLITNASDKGFVVVSGIPYLVLLALTSCIIKPVLLWYSRRRYNRYCFYFINSAGKEDALLSSCCMTPKMAANFYTQEENSKYYVVLVHPGKDFKSIPWKGDIYRDLKKTPPGFTEDFFKNWRKVI